MNKSQLQQLTLCVEQTVFNALCFPDVGMTKPFSLSYCVCLHMHSTFGSNWHVKNLENVYLSLLPKNKTGHSPCDRWTTKESTKVTHPERQSISKTEARTWVSKTQNFSCISNSFWTIYYSSTFWSWDIKLSWFHCLREFLKTWQLIIGRRERHYLKSRIISNMFSPSLSSIALSDCLFKNIEQMIQNKSQSA